MFTVKFKSLLITSLVFFIGLVQAQTIKSYLTNKTPNSRYTVNNSNGTVTDNRTNLMWKRCSEGLSGSDCSTSTSTATSYNWQEALQSPATLNATTNGYAGFKDWRLPNVAELKSILALDRVTPAINEAIFPNTATTYFWSSSPFAGGSFYAFSHAWIVSFYDGRAGDYSRNDSNRVRLVRGGQ